MKAIRYRNLDEVRRVLSQLLPEHEWASIVDDGEEEPQGLLSVVPEDRLSEESFLRLFGAGKGTLVEVEKIEYSGFGPPAEEQDYMGFISEQTAYVLKGCRFAIEIRDCPQQARDLHHLEALVLDRCHPVNREYLAAKLQLPPNWTFEDLFQKIREGQITAQEIDQMFHQGIQ